MVAVASRDVGCDASVDVAGDGDQRVAEDLGDHLAARGGEKRRRGTVPPQGPSYRLTAHPWLPLVTDRSDREKALFGAGW